jgi:hypothetical protein
LVLIDRYVQTSVDSDENHSHLPVTTELVAIASVNCNNEGGKKQRGSKRRHKREIKWQLCPRGDTAPLCHVLGTNTV